MADGSKHWVKLVTWVTNARVISTVRESYKNEFHHSDCWNLLTISEWSFSKFGHHRRLVWIYIRISCHHVAVSSFVDDSYMNFISTVSWVII